MKNLIKLSLVTLATLAFAACGKDDFDLTPGNATPASNHTKAYHDGSTDDSNDPGSLFTDKDKCKKCHSTGTATSGKMAGIDWTAPYMSNGEYASIEELINNFDFVNYQHLKKSDANTLASKSQAGITAEQKQTIIDYLKNLAGSTAVTSLPETK